MSDGRIYVIHENDEWVEPLRTAFRERALPFEEWFVSDGWMSLDDPPPNGVFYNRMSASSHQRNHRFAPEQTAILLGWLERHSRRVVNGTRALQLEISKAAQYSALNRHGIRTPRTRVAVGRPAVIAAAREFASEPLILKPNRGGSGSGVRHFESPDALAAFVASDEYDEPLDGVALVQEYVRSPDGTITRVELIGGELLYAVRVDTGGSFELCPADPCAIPRDNVGHVSGPTFTILEHLDPDLTRRYKNFVAANGIEIGAIEFIVDTDGCAYAYDVNTNTNYNAAAEARAGKYGMRSVARYLGKVLHESRGNGS